MFNGYRQRISTMVNKSKNKLTRRSNKGRKQKTEYISQIKGYAASRKTAHSVLVRAKSFAQDDSERACKYFKTLSESCQQSERLSDGESTHPANSTQNQQSQLYYGSATDYYVKSQQKCKNGTTRNSDLLIETDCCFCRDQPEPFCMDLKRQLASVTLSNRKSHSLEKAKTLILNINAVLDGKWPLFSSHSECNTFKVEKEDSSNNLCLLLNDSWSYETPINNRITTKINDHNSSLSDLLKNVYHSNFQVKIDSSLFTSMDCTQLTPFSPLQLSEFDDDEPSVCLQFEEQNCHDLLSTNFKREQENIIMDFHNKTGNKLLTNGLKLREKPPSQFFISHVANAPETTTSGLEHSFEKPLPFLSEMPTISDPSPLKYYPRKD